MRELNEKRMFGHNVSNIICNNLRHIKCEILRY